MPNKIDDATKLHHLGYNCAQAVACAYAEEFGCDQETAYRATEAFGFGMGCQDMCGALTGVLFLLGLQNSGGTAQAGKTKADTYRKARELEARFTQKVGSVLCREIKTNPPLCSCDGCVEIGAKIVEEMLLSRAESR